MTSELRKIYGIETSAMVPACSEPIRQKNMEPEMKNSIAMKKNLDKLGFLGMVGVLTLTLSSCGSTPETVRYEARTVDAPVTAFTTPLTADVEINGEKITYSEEFVIENAAFADTYVEGCKTQALHNAAKKYDADLIVSPVFEIKKSPTKRRITVTFTGYPARYKNFRAATMEDVMKKRTADSIYMLTISTETVTKSDVLIRPTGGFFFMELAGVMYFDGGNLGGAGEFSIGAFLNKKKSFMLGVMQEHGKYYGGYLGSLALDFRYFFYFGPKKRLSVSLNVAPGLYFGADDMYSYYGVYDDGFGYAMKAGAAFNLHFTDMKNTGVSVGLGYKMGPTNSGYFQLGFFF